MSDQDLEEKKLRLKYPNASASQISLWAEKNLLTTDDKTLDVEWLKFDTIISMIKDRGYKAEPQEITELNDSFYKVLKIAFMRDERPPYKPKKPFFERLGKVKTYESERAKRCYEDEESKNIL